MKYFTKNRILALVLIVFAAIVAVMVSRFAKPVLNSIGDPGPKLFPVLGIILVVSGSVGLLLQKKDDSASFMNKEETRRLLLLAASYVLYAVGLYLIGFIISTPIMLFLVMKLMAQDKKLKLPVRIIYSVVITAILYSVFTYVLKFKLPVGVLLKFLK